jgi:hypothetical protein
VLSDPKRPLHEIPEVAMARAVAELKRPDAQGSRHDDAHLEILAGLARARVER